MQNQQASTSGGGFTLKCLGALASVWVWCERMDILFWIGLAAELLGAAGLMIAYRPLGFAIFFMVYPFGIGLVASALGSVPKPRLRAAVISLSIHLALGSVYLAAATYQQLHWWWSARQNVAERRAAEAHWSQYTTLQQLFAAGQMPQAKTYLAEHENLNLSSVGALRGLFCSAKGPLDAPLLSAIRARGKPSDGDLLSAAAQCSEAATELILDAGVSPHALSSTGRSALMTGTDLDALTLLLERGAQLEQRTRDGSTALMFHRSPEVTRWLLAHGADPNAVDRLGRSALHYGGPAHVLSQCYALLLDAGADPNLRARTEGGETPLLALASLGEIVRGVRYEWNQRAADMLVAHGADPLALDHDGSSVLELRILDSEDISESLHWPSLKVKGVGGAQLLLVAIKGSREAQLQQLIEAGADPNVPTQNGIVPIDAFRASVGGWGKQYGGYARFVEIAERLAPSDAGR